MIKNLEDWFSALRDASLLPDAPVKQKDGKWEIMQRREAWRVLGPRVFDEYLDRLKNVAIEVLTERHPQFELKPEERFAASIHGKVLKHSPSLRKGIAETLALLGTLPEVLTSCSQGKPEATAVLAVREILNDADWVLWASLNDQLPTLAEAAPSDFLTMVEEALEKAPCPFVEIFGQEGVGITGQNYITGLLWALETLAWSPEHLQRVTVLLGELAAIDPGGNWANRPANSLTEVFLPWLPQTCAPIQKRKAAVTALVKEQPAVGWKLLVNLMPSTHSSSSGTRRPAWRTFIPDGWSDKVTNQEYWEQVKGYGELAVAEAVKDSSELSELIERLPYLPNPVCSLVLDHLNSDAVLAKPEFNRLPLWEALVDLAGKHRKFPGAQWVMPPGLVAQIEATAKKLAPMSPELLYHRLFSVPDYELFEATEDWSQQQKELSLRRQRAVREIFDLLKLEGLLDFARKVTNPGTVGRAFGEIAGDSTDSTLLPAYLGAGDRALREFVANFVQGRFVTKSWDWVDTAFADGWTSEQKATFLALLPFTHDTWRRAESKLGNDAVFYWRKADATPYGSSMDLIEAANKLLQHERPRAALRCLGRLIHEKTDFPPRIAVRAMVGSLTTAEPLIGLDQHTLVEAIEWLQNHPSMDTPTLSQLEWTFLPLLNHHYGATPRTLENRLATDPAFFCEVIETVFKSDKKEGEDRQLSEADKNIAGNAYRLIRGWQTVPGRTPEGTFDGGLFAQWLEQVSRRTKESGHFRVAMSQVGQVLPHAPPDPDGLWIHRSIAEALNARDASEMRAGFTCGLFNQRGFHVFSAGKAERERAKSFYTKADALEDKGYHRAATSLRGLAKSCERDAEHEANQDSSSD